MTFKKSTRLETLRYDIRGPVYEKALKMQAAGQKIINLNIGNPAPFGFEVPKVILDNIVNNIHTSEAQGYSNSKGIPSARQAVLDYYTSLGVVDAKLDHVFIGNGVSEFIIMCLQALLEPNDEVLVPSPTYPLWTASVGLADGKAVHYLCEEENGWNPSIDDILAKITDKTRAIVLINPNNPTGAVYKKEVLQQIVNIAEERGLVLFADEIYDKILYDDAQHHTLAAMVKNTLCVTFGGLSKNYVAAGFRGGWFILTGKVAEAHSYLEGLTLLASMRLCSNALAQLGIAPALADDSSVKAMIQKGGRLYEQINLCYEKLVAMDGMSCQRPQGSLYLFPKIDLTKFDFEDDNDFVMKLLEEKQILVVAGSGFNYITPDHFRIVILPDTNLILEAMNRLSEFLEHHRVAIIHS